MSDSLDYCFDTRVNNLPPAYTKDRKGRDNKAYLLLSIEKSILATCGGSPKQTTTFISNSLKTRDSIALGSGDRAIAFWAKMPKVASSQIFRFHRINTGLASKSAFGLDIKHDNPSNITAYTWGGGSNDYVFNTPLDTNWHFFLITVENSILYLNIDKTLIGSTSGSGLNTSTGQLFLGQFFKQDSIYIGNVMIYNHALTTNEVEVVYADSSIACVNPDVRQISKLDVSGFVDYAPQYLLAPIASANYLRKLDVEVCRFLKNAYGFHGSKMFYGAYLLVTYAIEVKADSLYGIYQQALDAVQSRVNVKSIIADEEGHLQEMNDMLIPFDPQWKAMCEAACEFESALFAEWIGLLAEEVPVRY